MKQNQNIGMTPNEFLTVIENITDDGLVEGDNFISHFNLAVDTINIELGTLFPHITDNDLDVVYPNLETEFILPVPLDTILASQKADIVSKKLDTAFPKWLKFLTIKKPTTGIEAYDFLKMDVTGGDSTKQESGRNLYRFLIRYTSDKDEITNPIEDAFKIYKLGGSLLPLEFGFSGYSEGGVSGITLYIKNTESIGEVLRNLNVSISDNNQGGMEIEEYNPMIEITDLNLTIDPLIESRDYFILDKFWLTALFSELIQKSIKVAEGDTPELYYKHESTIKKYLNKLRQEMYGFLPKEILPSLNKYDDTNNTYRGYFR